MTPDDLTALVLVGGLGTRLRSVVSDVPKPLAPVRGRPFLAYLLALLRSQGVRDVVLCAGYRAELLEERLGDGSAFGLSLRYSVETEALGTAGALRNALDLVRTEPALVLNGDSFVAVDIAALLRFHRERSALASILLARVERSDRFGTIEFDEADGTVRAFREKAPGAGWVNAGVYVVQRRLLEAIPPGEKVSLEVDVFPRHVGRGLFALPSDAPLLDIGTPESYRSAELLLPEPPPHG